MNEIFAGPRLLGMVLLAFGALLLALALLRHLRDQAQQRELRGDALAILGLLPPDRSPLIGPGIVLVALGLAVLGAGEGRLAHPQR